jgi:transposase
MAIKLNKAGVAVPTIAKSCSVGKQAVYKWIKKSKTEGLKSLKSTKAPGPEPALEIEQYVKLKNLLRMPASEIGYATDLWSGPRVRHLIKKKFGINYHQKHMPRLLRRLGLIIKFPERRALEQDPVALKKWKKYRLPKILKTAEKTSSLVFYADESLISLIPYLGKTWTFPELKPIARVSGKRGLHIGVTAAVNRQGRMCFEITKDKERFTAKVFIRFLKKMHLEFPRRRIILIVDGAPIHKAKIVNAFAAASTWLTLEILPAYSPEENPTEKLWGFVKTKSMNGSAARDKSELRSEARSALRRVKQRKDRIASFFEK